MQLLRRYLEFYFYIFTLALLFLASVSHGMADTPRMKDAKEYSLYFNKLLPIGTSRDEIEHLLKNFRGIYFKRYLS